MQLTVGDILIILDKNRKILILFFLFSLTIYPIKHFIFDKSKQNLEVTIYYQLPFDNLLSNSMKKNFYSKLLVSLYDKKIDYYCETSAKEKSIDTFVDKVVCSNPRDLGDKTSVDNKIQKFKEIILTAEKEVNQDILLLAKNGVFSIENERGAMKSAEKFIIDLFSNKENAPRFAKVFYDRMASEFSYSRYFATIMIFNMITMLSILLFKKHN